MGWALTIFGFAFGGWVTKWPGQTMFNDDDETDDDDFESAIHKRWESVTNDGDEHCKFDRVQNKRCRRPDLHAFLLLAELFPSDRDLIRGAAHDEIWLDVDDDQIETLTDDQIIELSRCGISHDSTNACLAMFV